jgi:hypothetical protein
MVSIESYLTPVIVTDRISSVRETSIVSLLEAW